MSTSVLAFQNFYNKIPQSALKQQNLFLTVLQTRNLKKDLSRARSPSAGSRGVLFCLQLFFFFGIYLLLFLLHRL